MGEEGVGEAKWILDLCYRKNTDRNLGGGKKGEPVGVTAMRGGERRVSSFPS